MFKRSVLSIFMVISCASIFSESELDRIIAPEVKNDVFYAAIFRLAQQEDIATILEIGSSSGDGSTEAFVLGMKRNRKKPTLYCMELSTPRFNALKRRYKNVPAVRCYQVSSIPLKAFPQESEVISFYRNVPTNLNQYACDRVIGWLRQDIDYVKAAGVPQNGIEIIKTENNITNFDMVLIDGSEFTGMAELKLVYGARYILLDDINAFKNYNNYMQLIIDPNYELIEKNVELRNGYAIFKRKNA